MARQPKSATPRTPVRKTHPLAAQPAPIRVQTNSPTVVFIHGIGNKPEQSVLKCQWDHALFGVGMGDRTRMAYWVNRERYPAPLDETCAEGDKVAAAASALAPAFGVRAGQGGLIDAEIASLTAKPREQAALRRIASALESTSTRPAAGVAAKQVGAKILPLPEFLRRRITEWLTRAFLRDVNDFLFDPARRQAMEAALLERLRSGGGPFVVIAHSQGSLIAYEVLRKLKKADDDVRLFLTIGSPLGIAEVQDQLKRFAGTDQLRVPSCVARWVNVADRLDPVAADPELANDYSPNGGVAIEDHVVPLLNPDAPLHPHSATGYLHAPPVQDAVRGLLGNAFAQAVGKFVVARDLVDDLEDARAEETHEVLIQLAQPKAQGTLAERRNTVVAAIQKMIDDRRDSIEPLKRFVAASLTRSEIERLRSDLGGLDIDIVWRNAVKRALIYESTHTIQARPANLGYGATGKSIRWAVLDTGIASQHPHFGKYANIVAQFDCTQAGAPVQAATSDLDQHGHGTHVAATIAGGFSIKDDKEGQTIDLSGMAPQAELYGYKVLDDQGNGRDSWIIKALDHIADLNDNAAELVIHGVNLSLGGNFDPSVYGCGHSPLCQELRRLWQQGVVVCLAAGNEGFAVLEGAEGEIQANMDISIGDPANLEEAIAVGSVHKTNPHTYGISYFSSRGPTADGRRKPDVVAPGERIVSACNRFDAKTPAEQRVLGDYYVQMSGTSMATPHVSGIIAAFLSLRREFIGYPDRVKQILLENCTDLRRDPNMQGHGLPNLMKMLANT